MQLKPLDFSQTGSSAKRTVEVTGTFPGSHAVMQYHLKLDNLLINSLTATG